MPTKNDDIEYLKKDFLFFGKKRKNLIKFSFNILIYYIKKRLISCKHSKKCAILFIKEKGGYMSNPILNQNFTEQERAINGEVMTVNGTIQVTAFLGLILLVAAAFVWSRFSLGYTDIGLMLTSGGAIVGFILALIIIFARVKILVPVYAACEGLFLGGISATMEASYPGIVSQAVAGTFAALFSMLILYRANIIKCTDKFRSVIFIATLSIAAVYLINFIGSFFSMQVPLLNSSSTAGIAISAFIVVIAALNLILDFDFIEKGAQAMLPKDMEWYGAFGLMVTLVWLYLEILRLLSKISSRD